MFWKDQMPREGALLFVLLAVLMMSMCSKALAAEPADDPPPSPIYSVVDNLDAWIAGLKSVPTANIPEAVRTEVAFNLTALKQLSDARGMLALEGDDALARALWLMRADAVCLHLSNAVSIALRSPQTTASRLHLQKLAEQAAYLQSVISDLRSAYVYTRVGVRGAPKEAGSLVCPQACGERR